MHGVLAARASVAGLLLMLLVASPVSAQELPDCAKVFVQPQQQSGTEVTPVATGSQFGVVVMVEGAEGVGLFASAHVTPLDCPGGFVPRPPQDGVEAPEVPAPPAAPSHGELTEDAVAALEDTLELTLP